jgi:hypothetical protein
MEKEKKNTLLGFALGRSYVFTRQRCTQLRCLGLYAIIHKPKLGWAGYYPS